MGLDSPAIKVADTTLFYYKLQLAQMESIELEFKRYQYKTEMNYSITSMFFCLKYYHVKIMLELSP
jgi:hypothetical protein